MSSRPGPPGTPLGHGQTLIQANDFQSPPFPVLPVEPGYEKPFENPTYSVPGYPATQIPGFWSRAKTAMPWFVPVDTVYGPIVGVNFRTVAGSPVFDLAAGLGTAGSLAPSSSTPITSGNAAICTFQVFGLDDASTLSNIAINALEGGQLYDPTADTLPYLGTPQDLSPALWDGPVNNVLGGTTVSFRAPQGIRYWQVTLVFDQRSGIAPLNTVPLFHQAWCR